MALGDNTLQAARGNSQRGRNPYMVQTELNFATALTDKGSALAAAFLIGLATTLTRSSMIGFWDVLPVFILMAVAIFMMIYEAFFDKN